MGDINIITFYIRTFRYMYSNLSKSKVGTSVTNNPNNSYDIMDLV